VTPDHFRNDICAEHDLTLLHNVTTKSTQMPNFDVQLALRIG
jgi:hypothetical protein